MNKYYVMYANPFGDHEEYPGGEYYSIKCCLQACVYIKNIGTIYLLTQVAPFE